MDSDFDTRVPHIARIYDYWLGGKDNYAADREAAELAMAATSILNFNSAPTAMWGLAARKP